MDMIHHQVHRAVGAELWSPWEQQMFAVDAIQIHNSNKWYKSHTKRCKTKTEGLCYCRILQLFSLIACGLEILGMLVRRWNIDLFATENIFLNLPVIQALCHILFTIRTFLKLLLPSIMLFN